MASAVESKVREIIAEQLGVSQDEVTPDASFIEDLGDLLPTLARMPRAQTLDKELDRL